MFTIWKIKMNFLKNWFFFSENMCLILKALS